MDLVVGLVVWSWLLEALIGEEDSGRQLKKKKKKRIKRKRERKNKIYFILMNCM